MGRVLLMLILMSLTALAAWVTVIDATLPYGRWWALPILVTNWWFVIKMWLLWIQRKGVWSQ